MRFTESEGFRISFVGQTVHHRTAGITQSHHLGTFVEGFASRVVYCLAYHLHIVICVHLDDLRITTRHQQAKERERRRMIVFRRFLNEMGKHMGLQMVDLDHRDIQRGGKSFGKRGPDEQGTHQSRSSCESDGAQFRFIDTGPFDGFGNHRDNILLMCPRSQFRNDTAISLVNGLAGYHVRQHHAVAYYRRGSIITG